MQYDTVFFAALNALAIFEGGGNLVDLNIRKVEGGKPGIGHLFFSSRQPDCSVFKAWAIRVFIDI